MSRLADPLAVETVDLGPCQCPGTPHERDSAVVRWSLGASALARIGRAELEGAVQLDPMAAYRQTVLETVESWNLLWPGPPDEKGDRDPVDVPLTQFAIAQLDVDTLKVIAETADKLISGKGVLPNTSGARSPASPRKSASPTRTSPPKPGT